MLKTQVAIGYLVALAISVGGALFAYWVAHSARIQVERAEAAEAVLQGFVELEAHAEQILRRIGAVAITSEIDESGGKSLRAKIGRTVSELRQGVLREIGVVSPEQRAGEAEELAELVGLEASLNQALALLDAVNGKALEPRAAWQRANELLADDKAGGFRALLSGMIVHERSEVSEADARTDALMQTLHRSAVLFGVSAVVVLLGMAFYFARRLRKPLEELMAATRAMREGDLTRRVRLDSRDEFGLIGTSLNTMAEDRAQQRQALLHAQDRLERTVVQRTEELRVANEQLTRVDATRRQLFADISHELRTPITAIRGEAEIALRGADKPIEHYREVLERITQTCLQLGRLVEDLLFIARSDAGVHRMNMGAVSLRALLAGVCNQAVALARDWGIEIINRPLAEDVIVLGDQNRLHQLFMILLDNSVQHSGSNSPVVVRADVQGDLVTVTVTDRGVGIGEHERTEVFRRFYRGDRANEHDGDGTGLGLPIAKAIVDAHGGTIELQSAPNAGVSVRVTLPISGHLRAVA